jgi:Porin-like glycoporin RafY
MTRFTKLTAVAAAVLLSAPAFAAMTTDANLELDNYFQNQSKGLQQGGRVEFNVAGKAGDANGFVAGRGTLTLQKGGGTGTDDMWGQIGTGMADVKLGRFEASDMFPLGKDVSVVGLAEASSGSRTQMLRGRFGSQFHGALTINPGSGVGFELGVVETKTAAAAKGIRPVVSFAAGPVAVKVGVESGKFVNGAKFNNFGVTVGGAFEGVGFNVNLGSGKTKPVGGGTSTKGTSFGANATFGPAGVGIISDSDKTGSTKNSDFVVYAAYSIPLFNTGATLTPAFSHQTGKLAGVKKDAGTEVKVRLNYGF